MTQLYSQVFTSEIELVSYDFSSSVKIFPTSSAYTYINGSAYVKSAPSYPEHYIDAVTPPSADYSVSADVVVRTVVSGNSAGVAARCSSTEKKGYILQLYSNGTLSLHKEPWATLGGSTVTIVAGTTYRLLLEVSGSTIKGYVDGVLKIGPITDSSITAAGFPGFTVWADSSGVSATTGMAIDNLSLDTLSSGDTISCSIGSASSSGFSASISSAISIACALGIATASGYQATITSSSNLEISCSLGTAVASGFNASIAAGGSATITSSVFKNNTGTVLASLTIQKAWAIPFGSPDFVDVVTDASGVLTITDGSLSAGDYLLVLSNADGSSVGVKKYTAV